MTTPAATQTHTHTRADHAMARESVVGRSMVVGRQPVVDR